MSKRVRGIVGAAAVALVLGAVPLAAGRDFTPNEAAGESVGQNLSAAPGPAHGVNRSVKADRIGNRTRSVAVSQTISLQVSGLADTSVLVRMPAAFRIRFQVH